VTIRRLGPGDEDVVLRLATRDAPARAGELLADDRTVFMVAFDDGEPVGFVLAYELIRRHGEPSHLFVYEIEVAESHRRRGIATALLRELGRIAVERGIRSGFVLTSESNAAAMALYESLGGIRPYDDDVMFDFAYGRR
jgi:aminoglycoside 3-N-acetyltransferase I